MVTQWIAERLFERFSNGNINIKILNFLRNPYNNNNNKNNNNNNNNNNNYYYYYYYLVAVSNKEKDKIHKNLYVIRDFQMLGMKSHISV